MNIFRKKRDSFINYLEMTPYCIHKYEINSHELVDVLVPKFDDKFLGKYLQPKLKSPYIHANLDEFGSSAWLEIDGKKSVEVIGKNLDSKFGGKIQPVYDRLTQFFTTLYRNGFINFHELKKG